MDQHVSRRDVIATAPALLATGFVAGLPFSNASAGQTAEVAKPVLLSGYPRQDAKLVAEVVGKSHRDEARVKELVKAHPALVNAWWDWGFGDWESPLGAASHVGQRGIAEFLLERGARMDIFAAAMLGYTDVVRACVVAQPGVQRRYGPHGITLLAHARAGGDEAAETLAYLTSLGDADSRYTTAPVPADRTEAYLGKYSSTETGVTFECSANKSGQMSLEVRRGTEEQTSRPNIHHVGNDEFFPSGVPSVRIRFAVEGGKAKSLSIEGTDPVLRAVRVGD